MILGTIDFKSRIFKWFVTYFNYFIILFIALLLILSYIFYFGPQKNKVEKIKNYNIVQEKQYYNQNKKYFDYLQKQEKKYETISSADKKRIQVMLPDGRDFPQIFAQCKRIITGNGYELKKINLSILRKSPLSIRKKKKEPRVLRYVRKIHINLTVGGIKNYSSYEYLLSILENNLRLIDLQGIDYSPNNKVADLEGVMYYYEPINKLGN